MVDQQVKVSNDLIAFYTTLNPIVRIRYLPFCRAIERGTLDSAATLNRFCKFIQKYSEFDRDRRFIFLF